MVVAASLALVVPSDLGTRPTVSFSTGETSFIWSHLAQFQSQINFRPVLCKYELEMGGGLRTFLTLAPGFQSTPGTNCHSSSLFKTH